MRTLTAVQATIAAAFLVVGVIALFGIGITGLLFIVPGVVFAAIAGVTQAKSRAAVILALAADTVIAYFAAAKLQGLLNPELMKPNLFDFAVPSAALALVALAWVAVLLDWRSVRAAVWF